MKKHFPILLLFALAIPISARAVELKLKSPPKTKTSFAIEPRATATFAKAAKLYGGLKSWNCTIQRSIDGKKDTPTEIDLVKPSQLFLVYKDVLPQKFYVNSGNYWFLDAEKKTYQWANEDIEGKVTAIYVLVNLVSINREFRHWLRSKNPLDPIVAREYYEGSISVEAKRLADALWKNEMCERVMVTEHAASDGVNGATMLRETFWIRARDGALLRAEALVEEKGRRSFAIIDDLTQQINPTLPTSRFVFTPPKGYKKVN